MELIKKLSELNKEDLQEKLKEISDNIIVDGKLEVSKSGKSTWESIFLEYEDFSYHHFKKLEEKGIPNKVTKFTDCDLHIKNKFFDKLNLEINNYKKEIAENVRKETIEKYGIILKDIIELRKNVFEVKTNLESFTVYNSGSYDTLILKTEIKDYIEQKIIGFDIYTRYSKKQEYRLCKILLSDNKFILFEIKADKDYSGCIKISENFFELLKQNSHCLIVN